MRAHDLKKASLLSSKKIFHGEVFLLGEAFFINIF